MKTNINPIHYVEEHKSCKHFTKEEDSAFEFVEFDQAGVYKSYRANQNALIFFISGSFNVFAGKRKSKMIDGGFMFAVSELERFKIQYSANSKMMIMYFNTPESLCSKEVFYSYSRYVKSGGSKDDVLSINPSIEAFIELLGNYVSSGARCAHLFKLKREELFLTLRWFYTKEELGALFYRVQKDSCTFKRFVLDNYMKFDNVAEMIEASNMCKSAFYKKFKKTFSVSVKQWLLLRQKQQVLNKASEPEMTAKDLMNEFNFSSPAHLTSFCKKQFGLTPTELIRKNQSN